MGIVTTTTTLEKKLSTLYNEDCIPNIGRRLRPESMDMVVTDPPFGIDFNKHTQAYNRSKSHVLKGYVDVPSADYYDFSVNWLGECKKVLKKTGTMWVVSGWSCLRELLNAADALNLHLVNHIIWKFAFGLPTKHKFVSSHYSLLFLAKNKKNYKFYQNSRYVQGQRSPENKSLQYADMQDVWNIKKEYWSGKTKTPTKLPTELITKILEYGSAPGDYILDPFAGSGQVSVTAVGMGRHAVGFEIVPGYYKFARGRLDDAIAAAATTTKTTK